MAVTVPLSDTQATPHAAGEVLRLTLRLALRFAVSLWALVTFSFLIVQLVPGDPVRAALGAHASLVSVNAKRAELGLDQPVLVQYLHYWSGLLHGSLGDSIQLQLPVSQVIADRLPNTLALAALAFIVSVAIAFPLGIAMAIWTQRGRHRGGELTFASTSVVIAAIPDFVLAVILVYALAVAHTWLPVAGREGPSSFIIPVLALAAAPAAILARIVRVEVLGVLDEDFVRTARSKRLPPRRIYLRHALPNAVTGALTVGGLILAGLVAGTVFVESVMAWPGLGPTMVNAIINKDYPLVQGIVIVYGVLVLLINLFVDVALLVVDPRARAAAL